MPEEYFAINHSMSRRTPSTMDSAGILAEVAALNGAKGTITLGTGTWRIDLATVTPTNVRLVPEQGAMLTKYGSGTLTINGPFEAPLAQVFSGFAAGDVTIAKTKEIRPEWFGAAGNYDLATGAGSDDTSAWMLALDVASRQGARSRIGFAGTYKITSTLTVPQKVDLEGAGFYASVLYFETPDGALPGLSFTDTRSNWRDFSVIGGASPGTYAIAGTSATSAQWNIYIGGGWDRMVSVAQFENCRLAIYQEHYDTGFPAIIPDPKSGFYSTSWFNASFLWIQVGTITTGNAVDLYGSYATANDGVVCGVIQGVVAGWAVNAYGGGQLLNLRDLHCEGCAHDINIENHSEVAVGPNLSATVTKDANTHTAATADLFRSTQSSGRIAVQIPAGARLSFNGTSDPYLYFDGDHIAVHGASLYTDAGAQLGSGNGVFASYVGGNPLVLKGFTSDGPTAVGVRIENINSLDTPNAAIAAFYSDNGITRRAAVNLFGGAELGAPLAGTSTNATYAGHGIPSDTVGCNGDFYLDYDNTGGKCLYQKRSSVWSGVA